MEEDDGGGVGVSTFGGGVSILMPSLEETYRWRGQDGQLAGGNTSGVELEGSSIDGEVTLMEGLRIDRVVRERGGNLVEVWLEGGREIERKITEGRASEGGGGVGGRGNASMMTF